MECHLSYGVSRTVLPATRYKWTHSALTSARFTGRRFTYSVWLLLTPEQPDPAPSPRNPPSNTETRDACTGLRVLDRFRDFKFTQTEQISEHTGKSGGRGTDGVVGGDEWDEVWQPNEDQTHPNREHRPRPRSGTAGRRQLHSVSSTTERRARPLGFFCVSHLYISFTAYDDRRSWVLVLFRVPYTSNTRRQTVNLQ